MEEKNEKTIRINKKHLVIFSCLGAVITLLTIGIVILCVGLFKDKEKTINEDKVYDEVMSCIEREDYQKAYDLLLQVKDQTKARDMLKRFEYKLCEVLDENGNVVEKYEYDKKGNCVATEKNMFFLTGKTEQNALGIHKYTYNGDGYLISDDCLEGDRQHTIVYMYDNNGNCIREEDGSYYRNYTYDKNNNLVRDEYSDFNSIITTRILVYDNKGLLKQERYYYSETFNASGDYEINYEYDNQGRLVKMIKDSHAEFETTINTYIYDKDGNCIEENMDYGRGWEVDNSKIEYDENGNILRIKTLFSAPIGGIYEEHTLTFNYEVIYRDSYYDNGTLTDEVLKDDKDGKTILTENEIKDIYSIKIEEYRQAANMDGEELYDKYQGECSSINTYILSEYCYYGGEISYALYDIDANGISELVFFAYGSIIDMYSISNGEIVKLFPDCYFGERSTLYILNNGIVLNEGSNGADSSSMTKYYLLDDGDSVEIKELMSYGYDESNGDLGDEVYKNEIGYIVYYEISSDMYINILDELLSNNVTDNLAKNIIVSK